MRTQILKATYLLTVILLLGGVSSCIKTGDCCQVIETTVHLSYKNEKGENLINSKEEFNESNIKIYYKIENSYEEIYHGNLIHPRMFNTEMDQDSNLIMSIHTSNYYDGIHSTTLIELNPDMVDTLYCEYRLEKNIEIITKAWLNGEKLDNLYTEVVR